MSLSLTAVLLQMRAEVDISGLGLEKDTKVLFRSALTDAVNKIIAALRERMNEMDIKASLALQQGIEYELNGDVADITMPFYWQFVNYGVRGVKRGEGIYAFKNMRVSKRFAESINKWRGHRGLGFDMKASYAIAAAVKRDGIAPRDFISIVDEIEL